MEPLNRKPFSPKFIDPIRTVGRMQFDFTRHVVVTGIINRTDNSILDPARSLNLDDVIARARSELDEGAEWIDIGGRAFTHDQKAMSASEEMARVVPAIREIRAMTDAVISVDTHLPEVAEAACEAGADVVNDTFGLRCPGMAEVIADAGVSVVITHSIGGPHHYVSRPSYNDVAADVVRYLRARVEYAQDRGIGPDKIFVDPGHDLNKNSNHSNELTRRLAEITSLGYPTMVAVSNKDFIRESLPAADSRSLTVGTIAVNMVCVMFGARIVRVHDVRRNVAAMRHAELLVGLRDLDNPRHNA